jgi:hypothetical protein
MTLDLFCSCAPSALECSIFRPSGRRLRTPPGFCQSLKGGLDRES